jgi:DNA-binding YbaB/EbfC family protein
MNINPFDVLKNAQKLQEQMGSLQEKLAAIQKTGSSGGGMVEVVINGKMEVVDLRIAPELMEGGDREMVQDLVIAAFNNALEKVREALNQEVGALMGIPGLNGMLPGFPGFGAPS